MAGNCIALFDDSPSESRFTTTNLQSSVCNPATPLYQQKLALNFVNKWWSLSWYSLLAD
jgi:hypothetical protein